MSAVRKLTGVTLAIAAATVFAATGCANTPTSTASAQGQCAGVNSCKGTGSCKGASNSCKGQNACKGQGFVSMTSEECKTAGGTFTNARS